MAESVDASDSKSDGSDTVRVQVPLWAPNDYIGTKITKKRLFSCFFA